MKKPSTALTLVAATDQGKATGYYRVMRGATFLAVVSFDGPRGTLVTHQGALYADERKAVYRLHATRLPVCPGCTSGGTHLPSCPQGAFVGA